MAVAIIDAIGYTIATGLHQIQRTYVRQEKGGSYLLLAQDMGFSHPWWSAMQQMLTNRKADSNGLKQYSKTGLYLNEVKNII